MTARPRLIAMLVAAIMLVALPHPAIGRPETPPATSTQRALYPEESAGLDAVDDATDEVADAEGKDEAVTSIHSPRSPDPRALAAQKRTADKALPPDERRAGDEDDTLPNSDDARARQAAADQAAEDQEDQDVPDEALSREAVPSAPVPGTQVPSTAEGSQRRGLFRPTQPAPSGRTTTSRWSTAESPFIVARTCRGSAGEPFASS